MVLPITSNSSNTVSAAQKGTIYIDGIYCYEVINQDLKEIKLIGIEFDDVMKELDIKGSAIINDTVYTVTNVDFLYRYYENKSYIKFYKSVEKLNIPEDFQGTISHPNYAFPNLSTVEFYSKNPPKLGAFSKPTLLFIVPYGTEKAYEKALQVTLDYSMWRDLYEKEIKFTPTIVTSTNDDIEFKSFYSNGFLYQVTKSSKNGIGTVQLEGHNRLNGYPYLSLPEIITNNGYQYKLTKINTFGLVGTGAKVIIIPDSVTEMASGICDINVELLFLSKNCKVIPSGLITDENNESKLRFIYVPEGVTTLSPKAFNNHTINTASIILPTTIKTVGSKSLYNFKLVTFLNKKPIANIKSAVKDGTTVKVSKTAIPTYQSVLNKKTKVIASKNVVKSDKLTVEKTSIRMSLSAKNRIAAKLNKTSNETIFWLSTNPTILTLSNSGEILPKKAGTAYVIAYTRTSGLHKVIKVDISSK